MRKIIISLFCMGVLLNVSNVKADFPPDCPNIATLIDYTRNLTRMYGPTHWDPWYYYFQPATQQPDGTWVQLTYYNLGAPVSDPVQQLKQLSAAYHEPQGLEITPIYHPETMAYECIYLGSMATGGYPQDDKVWHQVVTLHYSKEILVNLYIDTGPDLPADSTDLSITLATSNPHSEPYIGTISPGRNQPFQVVAEDQYQVVAPTTVQAGGHTYQLVLNNPYDIEPEALENGSTLLLNYKRVS